MKKIYSSCLASILLCGVGATAQDSNSDPLLNQLNPQQREEYQRQLNQATGDQQRNEIKQRYRDLSREQTREVNSPDAVCGNRGNGKGAQPGNPCVAGKSGMKKSASGKGAGIPAGDKSRPQKSGK